MTWRATKATEVLCVLAMIPAGLWLGYMVLVGLVEGWLAGWRASPWATLSAFAVLWLYRRLRRHFPPAIDRPAPPEFEPTSAELERIARVDHGLRSAASRAAASR